VSPEELLAELAAGHLRSAYLVAGSEPLLRDEALAALRRAVLGDAPADFNADRLEGDETAPGVLWDAVRTLPVLSPRRLVWLREPNAGRAGWKAVSDALPEIVRDLTSGPGTTVLVVTAGPLDRRLGWVRAFAGTGAATVECEAPSAARDLASFVRREAKRQGVRIEAGAVDRLVERVGAQLLRLRSELEKASLVAGPGAVIALEHVAEVADGVEEPVWELTDAIGEGRTADALSVLAKLLGGGAPAPVVLATLAGHLRRLLRVRAGGSVAGPPFVVRKLEAQARRVPLARLLAGLRAVHETDVAVKGQGGLAPELALERLVLQLSV
jgi:DNA polymerase-3 subunit delta